MKRKMMVAILLVLILLFTAACGGTQTQTPVTLPAEIEPTGRPAYDRAGNPITLPETIETIVVIAPAIVDVIVGLGLGDAIIATDIFSDGIEGVAPGIAMFTFDAIDVEYIIYLQPDVVIATDMLVLFAGSDPLSILETVGISVVYMPSSESIAGIQEDIRFLAAVLNVPERGEALVAEMDVEITYIRAIAAGIDARPTVYFEIGAPPFMVSLGHGTFLNEMIELVGAVNIFADHEGWVSVADEALLERNPDLILTSVFYIDDPVAEIMSRPGWNAITAVQNGDVFFIDPDSSGRPSQHIVTALWEMARAAHPAHFSR